MFTHLSTTNDPNKRKIIGSRPFSFSIPLKMTFFIHISLPFYQFISLLSTKQMQHKDVQWRVTT